MVKEDFEEYYRYTRPARLGKAINTLLGLLEGIAADGAVSKLELKELARWLNVHREFANRHPFTEIVGRVNDILTRQIIDEEDRADLLWLCDRMRPEGVYYDAITADMQVLQGILHGILADNVVDTTELNGLRAWINDHEHLRSCWPYDEIDSLLTAVLKDKVVDENEHAQLLQLFGDFSNRPGHQSIESKVSDKSLSVGGICAMCPAISFKGTLFCFTGTSNRASRRQFDALVSRLGAKASERVTKDLDYLVIGASGNPCWAFACYGRKVEQAVVYRRAGQKLLIVHENDFWDALEDLPLSQ